MNYFPRFASIESLALRLLIIGLHLPVMLLSVLISGVGGTIVHTGNFFSNSVRSYIESVFDHWVRMGEVALQNIASVAKGPVKAALPVAAVAEPGALPAPLLALPTSGAS